MPRPRALAFLNGGPLSSPSTSFVVCRRQEAVDLLLGVHRPSVDRDGNILNESIKEPLDLDLWTTRLAPHPATAAAAVVATARDSAAARAEGLPGAPPSSSSSPYSSSFSYSSSSSSGSVSSPPSSVKTPSDEGETSVSQGWSSGGTDDNDALSSGSSSGEGDHSGQASVGLREADARRDLSALRRRRSSDADPEAETGRGFGAEAAGGGVGVGGAAAAVTGGGREQSTVGGVGEVSVVERATGAALTELRMAGPYSVLALTVSVGLLSRRCVLDCKAKRGRSVLCFARLGALEA